MSKSVLKLYIRPAFFVPNIADRFHDNRRVHSIAYLKCNYLCDFCGFPGSKYLGDEYTLETFEKKIWELLKYSKNFKFTGGEPTLNPYLPELLRIVKIYGATTFLDTNGSRPNKVKPLIDEGLVDIVGISLKGLSAEESVATAKISNKKLCFDNVFETIDYIAKNPKVQLIITYVACEGFFKPDDLERLAELLSPYPNITLKINNCYHSERIDYRRTGLDKDEIYAIVESFVERHPEYKGRTVLFKDHDACLEKDKAVMF